MRITVLGGDERSIKLAKLLLEDHHIKVFGFDKEKIDCLEVNESLVIALEGSDIVIGPIPCSHDNEYLNTPLYSYEIGLREIFKSMKKEQIFIGGKITKEVLGIANTYSIRTIDLMKREELAVLNAIPTAEGAIQTAMETMDITLHGSNAMILGFGRVGKVLAKTLYGIGANVFVEARNHNDLAWIKAYGYVPIDLKDLEDFLGKVDVIFNTIPIKILDEKMLHNINKGTLVIDLASTPGGVDFEKAKELKIKTIWALGLPGKVAPSTAATVIKDTIHNIIEELGV